MSMLSAQCDELRTMAAMLVVKGLPEVASVVRDAADTITELRGALQVASVDYRHLLDENAKLCGLVRDFARYRPGDCQHCGYAEQCKTRQTNCYKVSVSLHGRARELEIEADG